MDLIESTLLLNYQENLTKSLDLKMFYVRWYVCDELWRAYEIVSLIFYTEMTEEKTSTWAGDTELISCDWKINTYNLQI